MKADPREYWNARAKSYDSSVGGIYADAYKKTASRSLDYLKAEDDVLEFACGTGVVTLSLAPHVKSLTAIDISDGMIREAREKAGDHYPNLTFKNTGLWSDELVRESFDVVGAYNVLLYLEEPEKAIRRIYELLKPGGVFLSVTDCLGGVPTVAAAKRFGRVLKGEIPRVSFFTPSSLARRIEAGGFAVLEKENLYHRPPNLFIAAKKR